MLSPNVNRRGFLKALAASAAAWTAGTMARWSAAAEAPARKPNIVLLFADDMGYGDPRCFNPQSKCPTPHIDRLAAEGIKLTDAHAPVGLCVPSRYGLMTGRYPFRSERYRLRDGEVTVASVLKAAGYRTAMVGKWHLGFQYPPGRKGQVDVRPGDVLANGPVDRGFDSYFGIPASLDIPPYYYIDNDRPVEAPTGTVEASNTPGWTKIQGAFWRAGGIAPGFKHDEVLPTFRDRALDVLDKHAAAGDGKPLFLYLALPAPHTPWLPAEQYRGKSGASLYGDFVAQVDGVVGDVLARLDKLGMTDDTLVIFTSDNGPVWYPQDVEKYGHASVGPLRGMKADVWEGGNRMPFVARWPGHVKPGSESGETICFTDLLATFAEVAGAAVPDGAGEDSFSFVPVLLGRKLPGPLRPFTILQSGRGTWSVRQGRWKLILAADGGGFSTRVKPSPDAPKGQLYDLSADVGERKSLYAEQPDVVARLTALLESARKSSRTAGLP